MGRTSSWRHRLIRLADYLKKGMAATPKKTLTKNMQRNLEDYERSLREMVEKGDIAKGDRKYKLGEISTTR